MPDDDWVPGYLAFFAEAHVRIGLVEAPDAAPSEFWSLPLWDIEASAEDVAAEALRNLRSEEFGNPEFILDIRKGYLSWGADGSSWTLTLDFAQLMLTEAGKVGIGIAIERLYSRIVGPAAARSVEPPTEEETFEAARWEIFRKYGVDRSQLQLIGASEDRAAGSCSVVLQGPDNSRYTVTVKTLRDNYRVTHVSWTRGDDT